jgi:hypothetical protein
MPINVLLTHLSSHSIEVTWDVTADPKDPVAPPPDGVSITGFDSSGDQINQTAELLALSGTALATRLKQEMKALRSIGAGQAQILVLAARQ